MAFSAIFPEFLVCCAIGQLQQARKLNKAWRKAWDDGGDKKECLGMAGAFFVVMGGYVITEEKPRARRNDDSHDSGNVAQTSEPSESPAGETSEPRSSHHDKAEDNIIRTLTASGMKQLLESGTLDKLIHEGVLTKKHFDHQKKDNIAKTLVSLQILWVVAQCAGRKIAGLPLTLLEIHILTQIPYGIVAYLCWWNKPLDVAVPIELPVSSSFLEWSAAKAEDYSGPYRYSYPLRGGGICGSNLSVFGQASFDFCWNLDATGERWSTVMGLLNGCVHGSAWVSHFPTTTEQWLWRAPCVGVGVMPTLTLIMVGRRDLLSFALMAFHRLAARGTCAVSDLVEEVIRAWREAVKQSSGGQRQTEGVAAMVSKLGAAFLYCGMWLRHMGVHELDPVPDG
ncbi:hypothetical protein QBC46DRAFT_401760 [Diplogelasinospora grovesii]|uniref:Uncharacterized protein n=1 Tax=Diplogelasinospora grovesii TaxID=303347 RepID=A0AAN6RYW4_9PEZI|nr:hypothetical protein QBC46DRAFT_401760 [Diplogelasinospora grovesii]